MVAQQQQQVYGMAQQPQGYEMQQAPQSMVMAEPYAETAPPLSVPAGGAMFDTKTDMASAPPATSVLQDCTLSQVLMEGNLVQHEQALRDLGCAVPADLKDLEDSDMKEIVRLY